MLKAIQLLEIEYKQLFEEEIVQLNVCGGEAGGGGGYMQSFLITCFYYN